MSTSAYRTAGILLLLTALATAISVPARLAADADATPFADSVAQRMTMEAAEIARLQAAEKLNAIGSASLAYGTGGVARLVGGLTLLAAGVFLWRAMGHVYAVPMAFVSILLVASGIASAVSGAAAVGLSVLAPEPQTVTVLTSGESGWARLAQPGEPGSHTATQLPDVDFVEEGLFGVRWITGSLGFTLAGLALVALGPVQWRMGGILRVTAVIDVVLGVAMLFIWLDAATAVHRITGVAFLIWLILVGLWLVIPRLRTIGMPAPSSQGTPSPLRQAQDRPDPLP